MMKRNLFKRILVITLLVMVFSLLGAYIWTQLTYDAQYSSEFELDQEVVPLDNGWILYTADDAEKGFILYPGAKVEPEAYAFIAQELASQNIAVAIPSVTLNLPILDVSKAEEIIGTTADMDWYIGGHSMGGAAAAMYADQHLDKVSGLILLGSYAADNDVLSDSDLPVLSISGSEDGLSTPSKIKENSNHLPQTAEFVEMEGGNHAQFGVYGAQSGDKDAKITLSEQQSTTIQTIVNWLRDRDTGGEDE